MSKDKEIISLSENDILVVHVDVGDNPEHIAQEKLHDELQQIKKVLQESGLDNKVMIFPKRGTDNRCFVEVLPIRNENDRLIFNICTGNMPEQKAIEYVNKLRNEYNDTMKSFWFSCPEGGSKTEIIVETEEMKDWEVMKLSSEGFFVECKITFEGDDVQWRRMMTPIWDFDSYKYRINPSQLKVYNSYNNGVPIECKNKKSDVGWVVCKPLWDWENNDYRIYVDHRWR